MKYIVCDKPGKLRYLEKEMPVRKSGEALLRMTRVGICGTDLHAFQGNQPFFSYPRILGHELAAEIVEIGANDKGLAVGDKVIIMPYLSCGSCIACRAGKTNCCTDIEVLGVHTDGGMQEYYTVPVDVLIGAGSLSDEEIAIVEPLAIGAHAVRRAEIKEGEHVLVVGCGPIGLGIIRQVQLAGGDVIVIDLNAERLAFVKDKMGVKRTLNALDSPEAKLKEVTNGDMPTIVIDATGSQAALEKGVQYMAHGGKYILVGLFKGDLTFNHPFIHSHEATIMSSRNATMQDMLRVKDILEAGSFPTKAYVTHQVSFSEMIDHFDSWIKPETGVIKAMVSF